MSESFATIAVFRSSAVSFRDADEAFGVVLVAERGILHVLVGLRAVDLHQGRARLVRLLIAEAPDRRTTDGRLLLGLDDLRQLSTAPMLLNTLTICARSSLFSSF